MRETRTTNWKVEIAIPEGVGARSLTDEEIRRDGESIINDIRRHVDGHGVMEVVHDTEDYCSFCGADWTEDSDTFNGGCCDRDMENEPEPEDET